MQDWLRIGLEFSGASRQEAATAEENVLRLLMQEIEVLLSDVNQQQPRRIWTLHKIIGKQVHFYKSNNFQRAANHRDLVRPISDGLIGQAINRDEDVLIFREADQIGGYIQGWDDCRSELIALVRDSRNNVIGVINIESNIIDDFFLSDTYNDTYVTSQQQKDDKQQQLKNIICIASNHISLIFRNQALADGEKSSTDLIKVLSEAPTISTAVLQEIIGNLAHWLNDRATLIRIILYITEPNDENKYRRLINIDLATNEAGNNPVKNSLPSVIEHAEQIRFLFGPGLRRLFKKNVTTIFGSDFSQNLLAGSEDPSIYFLATDSIYLQNGIAKYFIGVILDEPVVSNYEAVQTFFDISKNVIEKHQRHKLVKYSDLQNRATIKIYKTILQEENLRVALNKIATQIVDETEGRFCIIYLVATEDAYHSRHKFYLGGAGKGTVDFADIRFDQESSIVSYVLNTQNEYSHPDFFNCPENRHLLDRHLKEQGMEQPEVYAFPLRMKEFHSSGDPKIGVVLLFRENSESISGTNRPSSQQVKLRLTDWTEELSSVLYKKQKQTEIVLADTLKKLAETLPLVALSRDADEIICQLQTKVAKEVLVLWRDIINPALFVIYEQKGEVIEVSNQDVLPRTNFDPPKFKLGQGLTGSVIASQEVYEPFIEDFEPFTEDSDYRDSQTTSNVLKPDRVCKLFWDGVLGDKRRMYYGRHAVLADKNYVLLVVGVRTNKFLPYLGYKLALTFTDAIIDFLQSMLNLEYMSENK